jgi:basic membrane protein A
MNAIGVRRFLISVLTLCATMNVYSDSKNTHPAVSFTAAGIFDSSFNEAVYRGGVKAFTRRHGPVKVAEPLSEAEYAATIAALARDGYSPIVVVGFSYESALRKVAPLFPQTKFTILDAVVNGPNIQSVIFKEHEGSFMVGALAALTSKTNIIGFVGGQNVDFIRRFSCGYAQGARYINKDIVIEGRMIGDTYRAWENPARGALLANELMDEGVDVVYAAAGGSSLGVYDAVNRNLTDTYAIAVDSDLNYLYPGKMLTSMVKNVGDAALHTWVTANSGKWEAGVIVRGISDQGLKWSYNIFNETLLTDSALSKMMDIESKVVSGDIVVSDSFLETTTYVLDARRRVEVAINNGNLPAKADYSIGENCQAEINWPWI